MLELQKYYYIKDDNYFKWYLVSIYDGNIGKFVCEYSNKKCFINEPDFKCKFKHLDSIYIYIDEFNEDIRYKTQPNSYEKFIEYNQ